MANPNMNEFWIGPGYLYSTVDALVETLPSGRYTVHDGNCSGTNGVGDDWTVDPFNPTSGVNLHLTITYGPCKYPLATEVPLAIGQSSSLTLLGVEGKLGSAITGCVVMAGPSFSPGPISGIGPTPSVTATSTGCNGNTFGSTTLPDAVATYVQNINSNASGVNGQTVIGAAQTSISIPAGSCASYTVASTLPVNAAGVSLFATLHSNPGAYSWQVTGKSGSTITFPASGGASASLVTNNPSPPGFNTSGALIYLGRRNENTANAGNEQFGATFTGVADPNGVANYCLINVGAEEMSGAFGVVCLNPLGPAGVLIEGFNGSVTTNNSSVGRLAFDASSCKAATPCGGYPGAGSISTAQEPGIAPLIVDQVSSFRGGDNITCTPIAAIKACGASLLLLWDPAARLELLALPRLIGTRIGLLHLAASAQTPSRPDGDSGRGAALQRSRQTVFTCATTPAFQTQPTSSVWIIRA